MLFIILYQMMMLITPIEVDERQELVKKGISLSILTNRDMRKFGALEKRLKLKMTKISIPSAKDIASKRLYILGQKIF